VEISQNSGAPVLRIVGLKVFLELEDHRSS
jgi:hypothetical protein